MRLNLVLVRYLARVQYHHASTFSSVARVTESLIATKPLPVLSHAENHFRPEPMNREDRLVLETYLTLEGEKLEARAGC